MLIGMAALSIPFLMLSLIWGDAASAIAWPVTVLAIVAVVAYEHWVRGHRHD